MRGKSRPPEQPEGGSYATGTNLSNIFNNMAGLIIHGKAALSGGTVDSVNDHRIAMSAAVAAIVCENAVTILDAESVNKSYPAFFQDYKKLGGIVR